MIIIKNIILYFIQIRHTDDFPSTGTRLVLIIYLSFLSISFFIFSIYLRLFIVTFSVLQAYCAVITEYGIPSDFVRKLTASLQIKISTGQLNFSNRNVIIF